MDDYLAILREIPQWDKAKEASLVEWAGKKQIPAHVLEKVANVFVAKWDSKKPKYKVPHRAFMNWVQIETERNGIGQRNPEAVQLKAIDSRTARILAARDGADAGL